MEGPLEQKNVRLQTLHYQFSKEIIPHLTYFAEVHQYDDRKAFKEEWKVYLEDPDVKVAIRTEVTRLLDDGFKGDPMDKMFKYVRFYYKKKATNADKSPRERKEYEGFSKDFLKTIDKHIQSQILENISSKSTETLISEISPTDGFADFSRTHGRNIVSIVNEENAKITKELVGKMVERVKKTYVNRFYNFRKKLQKQ